MPLSVVTAAALSPVALQTLKDHLKVTDTAEDTLLTGYLAAAVEWVEDYIKRPLITRTMKLTLDLFPASGQIELAMPPVSAVSHVKYYNTAGTLTTLSSSDYWTVLNETDGPGLVILKSSASWPDLQEDRPRAVEVTFTCGYGATVASVPNEIRQAILILAAHLWDARLKEVTGTIVSQYAFSVHALLAPRRFYTFA